MKKYCFALDLIDDKNLIRKYKEYHRNFWRELREHSKKQGITKMEIYNVSNRLFMVMETSDDYNPYRKPDPNDPMEKRSLEWEELMSQFQKPILNEGEKWVLMEKIFEL